MKTKQEQIAEMEKIIKAEYEQWLDVTDVIPKATTYYAECMGCAIDSAEAIYNAGYRKTFTNDLASDTQKAFKEGYEKGCETCGQAWANGYNYGYKSGKEDGVREWKSELVSEIERLKAENARLTDTLKRVLLAVDTVKEMNAMCNIDEQTEVAEK